MRVVFTRHADDTTRFISVYDHEEDVFQDLTNFFGDGDPVWSPDGSKILFLSGQDNNAQLYFMNADGTFIQQITQLTGLRGRPDWASNLAIVTYGGEAEEHNREIILLTISGEPRYITEGGDNLAPSFSPDGQWIVFVSYRDHFWEADGCELYLMRRDGTDVRRLTQNDYCDDQPRWGQ
jgi:Tol biopolymer transport system component